MSRAARLAGGGPRQLVQAATVIDRALCYGQSKAPEASAGASYEPRLIHADCDRAALRRFTFKVKFDFLTPEQVSLAFRTFFASPAPRSALRLANLTPSDFAVVARRLRYLNDEPKPQTIADLLEQECRLKPDQARPIGFAAGV